MTCPEMIEGMAAKRYWSSPKGATPAATLYSAILREINAKGKEARFVKTDRGKFGLAKEQPRTTRCARKASRSRGLFSFGVGPNGVGTTRGGRTSAIYAAFLARMVFTVV